MNRQQSSLEEARDEIRNTTQQSIVVVKILNEEPGDDENQYWPKANSDK